ncbi:winged helix-turn-helix domain-containing protein [Aliiroseovarius sp. Z3]|uniref:winged helix-turn-helix domain-containing protein n=1 Tax=Aliiroseovarius sp. Z3 TaxID=2811402 RepID=UPI0023B2E96E|nr:winged helix-turn-helix domain-containing protein [Aliiroseovarius sp. Z3]MDE9452059.1 winged helix-turn-helix domain-containing protein [Aliiroseovarius sp. Z3]
MAPLQVDLSGRSVVLRGREIALRSKTFDLLRVLVESRGQAVPAEDLKNRVWPDRMPSRDTLKSTVQQLRLALGETARRPVFIQTKRGFGYEFVGSVSLTSSPLTGRPDRAFSVAVLLEYTDCADLGVIGILKTRLEDELNRFETLQIQFSDCVNSRIRTLSELRLAGHRVGADFVIVLRAFRNDPEYPAHELFLQVVHGHSGTVIWSHRIRADSNRLCEVFPSGVVAQRVEKEVVQYANSRSSRRAPRTAMDYCQIGFAVQPDNKGLNEEARCAFEMALSLDNGNVLAWCGLAETHFNDAFHQYTEDIDKSLDTALRYVQRATRLGPTTSRPAWIMGRVLQLRHEWRLAEKAFARAIFLNPSDSDAQSMMGSFLLHAGRSAEAVPFLHRSIALNPIHETRAFWALGAAFYNLGRYETAIESLDSILIRRPNFTRPYRLVAASFAMMGRPGRAREVTRTHLGMDPSNTLSSAESYMERATRSRRDIDHLLTGFEKAGFPT